MTIAEQTDADVAAILSHRHDQGADWWTTPDRKLLKGAPFTTLESALDLLEQVGAIRRVKRGRVKIITVTPEGAFRGNVHNHAQAVERYKLDVIDGGKTEQTPK